MLTLISCAARGPHYDVAGWCEASRFLEHHLEGMELPRDSSGAAMEGAIPIRAAPGGVTVHSEFGWQTLEGPELAELLPIHVEGLVAPVRPVPVAIDRREPGAVVALLGRSLRQAGFEEIALVVAVGSLEAPPAPDPALVAGWREGVRAARGDRSASFELVQRQRAAILACASEPHVESLLAATWPHRCSWVAEHGIPFTCADQAANDASASALYAVLLPAPPLEVRVVAFPVARLESAEQEGTFEETFASWGKERADP